MAVEDKRYVQEEIGEDEIDLAVLLHNIIRMLKKCWWLVFLLALLGGGAAWMRASVFYTPMYQSAASFTVMTGEDTGDGGYNFYYDSSTAGQLAKTFPYILQSNLLTDAVKEDMGTDVVNGSISAEAVSDSNLVTMRVVSSSPKDAKNILESVIKLYPSISRYVIGSTRFNMIDVPSEPVLPYNRVSYKRELAKGAAAGTAAAGMIIVLLAFFRRTVQQPDDLKEFISLSCLGNIPEVRIKARSRRQTETVSILEERGDKGFKENILGLAVKVMRNMEKKKAVVLLVTSTVSGEGKSTIARNLAYALSGYHKKVLFIDGDLRKQDDGLYMRGTDGKGLEAAVKADNGLKRPILRDEKSGVWLVCGSHPAANVRKVLNSSRLPGIIEACREGMDFVIIDAPPCEMFEDAELLAQYADSILYVVRCDYVPKQKVINGISVMGESEASLLGFVFNGTEGMSGYGYGKYSYGRYGYGKYGYGYGKYGYGYGEKDN